MTEKRWVGTDCRRCGLPIQDDDPQEYNDYMMPVHREDYCVRYLKEALAASQEVVRNITDWADANNMEDECPRCDRMLYPWEVCDCEGLDTGEPM
jgi:hypothetical protein